jgi:hypothetical protein
MLALNIAHFPKNLASESIAPLVLRQRRGLFSGGQLFGINVSPHHGHSRRSPSTRLNSSGSIRARQCGQTVTKDAEIFSRSSLRRAAIRRLKGVSEYMIFVRLLELRNSQKSLVGNPAGVPNDPQEKRRVSFPRKHSFCATRVGPRSPTIRERSTLLFRNLHRARAFLVVIGSVVDAGAHGTTSHLAGV